MRGFYKRFDVEAAQLEGYVCGCFRNDEGKSLQESQRKQQTT
jgi:hypothetical protein